jgi:hypothetical protein
MNQIVTQSNESDDIVVQPLATFDAKTYVAAVFDPFKKQLNKAKREAAKVESYDITTTAGMAKAKELRAMFREIRTSLENERKARKAPIIESGKLLDTRAAEMKAEIEPFEDKYDAEIKAEEARKEAEKQKKLEAERVRIEAIQNRINGMRNTPARLAGADAEVIARELHQLNTLRLDPADYEEFLEDALTALNATVDQLGDLHANAMAREAEARRIAEERAELARLKAEQEAREKAEREAEAERQRAAKAEADRIEAERRAAAEREADLVRQLEAMKAQMAAQMAAQVAAASPAPVLEQEPAPSPIKEAQKIEESPEIETAPIVEMAPVKAIPIPRRPTDFEMIDIIAEHFNVSGKIAVDWLASINFAVAYDQLSDQA